MIGWFDNKMIIAFLGVSAHYFWTPQYPCDTFPISTVELQKLVQRFPKISQIAQYFHTIIQVYSMI